jgi:hypothetical protein
LQLVLIAVAIPAVQLFPIGKKVRNTGRENEANVISCKEHIIMSLNAVTMQMEKGDWSHREYQHH